MLWGIGQEKHQELWKLVVKEAVKAAVESQEAEWAPADTSTSATMAPSRARARPCASGG